MVGGSQVVGLEAGSQHLCGLQVLGSMQPLAWRFACGAFPQLSPAFPRLRFPLCTAGSGTRDLPLSGSVRCLRENSHKPCQQAGPPNPAPKGAFRVFGLLQSKAKPWEALQHSSQIHASVS